MGEVTKINYINKVAILLQPLPQVVTKQEVQNYYIHTLNLRGTIAAEITLENLIEAAVLAGKQVKGKSKLQVNVSIEEQLRYIREGNGAVLDKESFRQILIDNKETIVQAYESGIAVKEIAAAYGTAVSTMLAYLNKFGAKMKKAGRPKAGETFLRETGTNRKRRRRSNA